MFLLIFLSSSWFEEFLNYLLCLAAAHKNPVLLLLTIIMEVVLVCFLLSTLNRLPYELESKIKDILLKYSKSI